MEKESKSINLSITYFMSKKINITQQYYSPTNKVFLYIRFHF